MSILHHYVYRSYEPLGRSYIGCRSCTGPIEEDAYLGSYTDPTFDPTHKEIMAVCDTREEALRTEMFFHEMYDVARNPMFANRAKQTSTGYDTTGFKWWYNSTLVQEQSSVDCPGSGWVEGRKSVNETTKQKISKRATGRKQTVETRRKIGLAVSGEKNPMHNKSGENSPGYGTTWWVNTSTKEEVKTTTCPGDGWVKGRKPVSEEARQKMSNSGKGKLKSRDHKAKIQKAMSGENNLNRGKKWWVNVYGETKYQKDLPGEGWRAGRKWKQG